MTRPLFLRENIVDPVLDRVDVAAKAESYNAPLTLDGVLSACPTQSEMNRILADFSLTVDSSGTPFPTKVSQLGCIVGGDKASTALCMLNVFRCFKALKFSSPIPVINATSVYDWLKASGVTKFGVIEDGFSNSGDDTGIRIRKAVLVYRRWDNGRGVGMIGLCSLFVHEAMHVISGKNHDCGILYDFTSQKVIDPGPFTNDGKFGVYKNGSLQPKLAIADILWSNDSSLAYGGAWAAQYWWNRWLYQASGGWLTDTEKKSAYEQAANLLAGGSITCGVKTSKPLEVADQFAIASAIANDMLTRKPPTYSPAVRPAVNFGVKGKGYL